MYHQFLNTYLCCRVLAFAVQKWWPQVQRACWLDSWCLKQFQTHRPTFWPLWISGPWEGWSARSYWFHYCTEKTGHVWFKQALKKYTGITNCCNPNYWLLLKIKMLNKTMVRSKRWHELHLHINIYIYIEQQNIKVPVISVSTKSSMS